MTRDIYRLKMSKEVLDSLKNIDLKDWEMLQLWYEYINWKQYFLMNHKIISDKLIKNTELSEPIKRILNDYNIGFVSDLIDCTETKIASMKWMWKIKREQLFLFKTELDLKNYW